MKRGTRQDFMIDATETAHMQPDDLRWNLERAGLVIVWDPGAISAELYAELVVALGNVVRACGGAGIERGY